MSVFRTSLPLWERGLKWISDKICWAGEVAPLVGAWIEIDQTSLQYYYQGSLPLWERGLK